MPNAIPSLADSRALSRKREARPARTARFRQRLLTDSVAWAGVVLAVYGLLVALTVGSRITLAALGGG